MKMIWTMMMKMLCCSVEARGRMDDMDDMDDDDEDAVLLCEGVEGEWV
jgi:hypothetical protein